MPSLGMNAERAAIIIGFGLTVLSLLLTQFYAEPAQHRRSDVQEQLAAARTKAKVLSAANAMDNIFGQLGTLVFTLDSRDQPNQTSEEVVRTLQQRALDWRHDGVRTYIAQLAVAGELEYASTAATYETLVEDERRLGTIAAYKKANEFEANLSMHAVKDGGDAAMAAITLHSAVFDLDTIVQHRKLILLIVTVVGSTFILLATLIDTSTKPLSPPNAASSEDLAATMAALKIARDEIGRRIADVERQSSPSDDL